LGMLRTGSLMKNNSHSLLIFRDPADKPRDDSGRMHPSQNGFLPKTNNHNILIYRDPEDKPRDDSGRMQQTLLLL
ncbi:MAG: hypothetical protein ACE365_08345, partial [Gammaproteobacteria bacterium]